MSRWNFALASLVTTAVIGGCTIYTEDARHPPPPPPTPPTKAPPPPAQAAPPPAQPGGLLRFGRRQPTGPATPNTPPPQQQQANLVVTVADGSCDITIDKTAYGMTNKVEVNMAMGDHQVTCQPAGGKLQSQIAQVRADAVAAVVFSITNPGTTGTHSLPIDKAPPVGRPTPK